MTDYFPLPFDSIVFARLLAGHYQAGHGFRVGKLTATGKHDDLPRLRSQDGDPELFATTVHLPREPEASPLPLRPAIALEILGANPLKLDPYEAGVAAATGRIGPFLAKARAKEGG